MNLKTLVKKLLVIRTKGFVKTHRAHDTGIGKTIEDLLGIKENNLRLPDAGEIELKAKRIDSGSMLTVATKSTLPNGANKVLFERYKYKDKEGHWSLRSTVCGSRKNPQGLRVVFQGDKLFLKNPYNVTAYWPISIFDEILKSKSNKILLIFAETHGERKTMSEKFHYLEAYLLSGLSAKKFKNAIKKDSLKVDIRIGVYRSGKLKGRYHDHGTGFRINKKDFLKIFDGYKKLM